MATYVKQGDIFGRVGSGIGQGLAEQLPKEIERGRLASGLEKLGQQKGLNPFQQFASLASLPGITPQMIQSGSDLLRQQAIIDSIKQQQQPQQPRNAQQQQPRNMQQQQAQALQTATTPEGTQAKLRPYIPPSGEEIEARARQRMANEPLIYPNMESARAAENAEVASNVAQSNAKIQASELQEGVQSSTERKLREQIQKEKSEDAPAHMVNNIEQRAVDDVVSGRLSPDAAKVKYGNEVRQLSRDVNTIKSWGGPGLITNKQKDLFSSIRNMGMRFREKGEPREFADLLVAKNELTPDFAYAAAMPVSEIKPLNDKLKSLPQIQSYVDKAKGIGLPMIGGVAGAIASNFIDPAAQRRTEATNKIVPDLAKAMGKNGSPLSVSYELKKKGYDPQAWKDYLIEHQKELDLTVNQVEELSKTNNSFFGWMNDWWFKSFTGIK